LFSLPVFKCDVFCAAGGLDGWTDGRLSNTAAEEPIQSLLVHHDSARNTGLSSQDLT